MRPLGSWLIGYSEDEVWDHIMPPIENLQCQALRDHGRPDLVPLVPRYNAFLILLGMVWPMQVDSAPWTPGDTDQWQGRGARSPVCHAPMYWS